MTTQSITSITDGQKKQVKRFAEDAVDRAIAEGVFDKDGLQRVIEKGDDLQAAIVAKLRELLVSSRYADEEVSSGYTYPSKYYAPSKYYVKSIAEQVKILRQFFPGLGSADDVAQKPLPDGAEGWFAIPRWGEIAIIYNMAVEKVLEAIETKRKFYNCRGGWLGPQHLRRHERKVKKLQVLSDQQKDYDILVVPAQFGLHHRGRSVRRAREVFMANEFGLGAFEIGCMLLTHPERLVSYDDLWIDCAGDEYTPGADGVFSHAPAFSFLDGRVEFSTVLLGPAGSHSGSASGFLPQ